MATVTKQPGSKMELVWMDMPVASSDCPPGLEYLTQIDQILVHQQVELFEAFTDIETKNKYQIKNALGQQIFFAKEHSGACMRIFCTTERGFRIVFTDNNNQEVMQVVREFKCCAGCCWCANDNWCAYDLRVEAPIGTPIAYIRQEQSWCAPHLKIMDTDKRVQLYVRGPCCVCQVPCCCTADIEFNVFTKDLGNEVGKISKQWAGLLKELLTKADVFGVTFPLDLDVKMKAGMIGALFLLDFMCFEEDRNNANH